MPDQATAFVVVRLRSESAKASLHAPHAFANRALLVSFHFEAVFQPSAHYSLLLHHDGMID